MGIDVTWFRETAMHPSAALRRHKGRAAGLLPYYTPPELVWAAGLLPLPLWGAQVKATLAGRYYQPWFCSLALTVQHLALSGAYEGLSCVVCAPLCDTLRGFTQNFRASKTGIPLLTYSQPQNRSSPEGVDFLAREYRRLYRSLCALSGAAASEEKLREAMALYENIRAEQRRFVTLGRKLLPSERCMVLKAGGFAEPNTYLARLRALNGALDALPLPRRIPVVTSGILCDQRELLRLLDDLGFSVAADDVAAESRSLRFAPPIDEVDPFRALALGFAAMDHDPLLLGFGREEALLRLTQESGAKAVLFLRQQFCEPEEVLLPPAREALARAGIPSLVLTVDQQVASAAQSATLLETLADMIGTI